MRDYELVVVFNPDLVEEDLNAAIERLNEAIARRGGEVKDTNRWGRRRLAYPIKRRIEGSYVVTQMRMDPNETAGLEAGLQITEDVLRHLLVRLDED